MSREMFASSPRITHRVAVLLVCMSSCIGFSPGIVRPATPPMGWRSWNWFKSAINQTVITQTIDALTKVRPGVNGAPDTSLIELGYNHVGLDDAWQVCGGSKRKPSFHDPVTGTPMINTDKFPDMAGMVRYGQSRGVKMGFYLDNCICHETGQPTHYQQDANITESLGFDGVKIDSCGNQRDMEQWAALFSQAGKDQLVESCGNGPEGTNPKKDFPPQQPWINMLNTTCPFSFYRVSVDVAPQFYSTIWNANWAVPFLGPEPLSRPGCFAYPDMLEVGVKLTYNESRTHFGLWCVISSPLILGFDLRDSTVLEAVWDIIANPRALRISQSWAGHPGRLVLNASDYIQVQVEHGASGTRTEAARLPEWQVWAKAQPGGAQAVLIVNIGDAIADVTIKLADLGLDEDKATVENIWTGAVMQKVSHEFRATGIHPRDSVFVLLTPS